MDLSEIVADYRRMSNARECYSTSVIQRLREAIPEIGEAGNRLDDLLAGHIAANIAHKDEWYAARGITPMGRLDLDAPDAPDLPVPAEAHEAAAEYRRLLIEHGAIAEDGPAW